MDNKSIVERYNSNTTETQNQLTQLLIQRNLIDEQIVELQDQMMKASNVTEVYQGIALAVVEQGVKTWQVDAVCDDIERWANVFYGKGAVLVIAGSGRGKKTYFPQTEEEALENAKKWVATGFNPYKKVKNDNSK